MADSVEEGRGLADLTQWDFERDGKVIVHYGFESSFKNKELVKGSFSKINLFSHDFLLLKTILVVYTWTSPGALNLLKSKRAKIS